MQAGKFPMQCLAAMDWFLFMTRDDLLAVYRFDTLTCDQEDMAAYRDFTHFMTLFTGSPGRSAAWIKSMSVSDSFLKMWDMGKEPRASGTIFPYMKSLGLIYKLDLSASEHKAFHNFTQYKGSFLGIPRSKKSTDDGRGRQQGHDRCIHVHVCKKKEPRWTGIWECQDQNQQHYQCRSIRVCSVHECS